MSDSPVYLLGHSLGAARAWLAAWSRVRRGLRVDGVYALAPPNPGDGTLRAALEAYQAANGLVARSLINGRDIVPDVPVDLKLLGEEYVQSWPLTEIYEAPMPGGRALDPWHAIGLYQAGATKIPATGGALELAEAADWVAALYQKPDGWDWAHEVDGEYCVGLVRPSGVRCGIFRGSITALDWLDDFDARQVVVMGSRVSEGFWRGVAAAEAAGLDSFLGG